MSGISTGIGLITGINSAAIIDQLIALESLPLQNLQIRSSLLDVQRAAFAQLAARILAVQNAALPFRDPSFFRQFTATSTDDTVLTATASDKAVPGSYTFKVHSLVANHAVTGRGFPDSNSTSIGTGTMTIEVGNGKVDNGTDLAFLNGGGGVRRGSFTITDRAGNTAEIDITTAVTVEDVLNLINDANVNVKARVTSIPHGAITGDRIVLEDFTEPGDEDEDEEGFVSELIVADHVGGFAAADLGIVGSTADDRLDGTDLVRLSDATPLALLNDGNGVGRAGGAGFPDLDFVMGDGSAGFSVSLSETLLPDAPLAVLNGGLGVRLGTIRITDRSGASADIDLSGAVTVQDVIDAMQTQEVQDQISISVAVVSINDDSHFQITDTSDTDDENALPLKVEDVDGFAAADLGIAGESDGTAIIGSDIYRVQSVGDVINLINFAPENAGRVHARISDDGNGITLVMQEVGNSVTVHAAENSSAAEDLGIAEATADSATPFTSRRLIAGLNTVLLRSLNGGAGVTPGLVAFDDGTSFPIPVIDFSAAETLQDVVDLINEAAQASPNFPPLTASINRTGNGIEILDANSSITIADQTGTLAGDLKIAVQNDTSGSIQGGNVQLQYISRNILLADFNNGNGVAEGTFRITRADGSISIINASSPSIKTLGDMIDAINQQSVDLEARINDTGDGIIIIDNSGGSGSLSIEDLSGGSTAKDLRLAGSAKNNENFIDGTFEIRIDVNATDTLADIALKINDAGGNFIASVLNNGGAVNAFSLTITSDLSGRAGELVIDSGGIDFGFETLAEAKDAVVTFGGASGGTPVLVTASSNTLDSAIQGVTIDLLAAGDEEVTLSIEQDIDGIVEQITTFVSAYNDVQANIDEQTSFNPETFARGTLFGDPTVELVRGRLQRTILRPYEGVNAAVSRMFLVGLSIGANNRLDFDEPKFREKYDDIPDLVEELFTLDDTGFGDVLNATLDELTRDFDGVIARKDDLLSDQQEILNDRIKQLNLVLAAKRARLEREFAGLETSIANLQDQQSSLFALSQILAQQQG